MTNRRASLKAEVPFDSTGVRDAIVRVGDGRGCLLVNREDEPLILTAAHCLPHLPRPMAGSDHDERTYRTILGPVGSAALIAAECLYVDPVADLAVLGSPDSQWSPPLASAYERFTEARSALRVGGLTRRSSAWLLSLDGEWQRCTAAIIGRSGHALTLINAQIAGGMSGSPILDARGRVIGTVCLGTERGDFGEDLEQHGQPVAMTNLPAWLLFDLQPSPLSKLPGQMSALASTYETSVRAQLRGSESARRWTRQERRLTTLMQTQLAAGDRSRARRRRALA